MRREWIEIYVALSKPFFVNPSPSMRREWIEMTALPAVCRKRLRSPSMRREWIEIGNVEKGELGGYVSLHAEGVD